ncbi:MAG: hypothetical protein OXT68_16890 [Chloroflexota bacterium]|nr:hypothetical protein [Chloroflexota bacterium]
MAKNKDTKNASTTIAGGRGVSLKRPQTEMICWFFSVRSALSVLKKFAAIALQAIREHLTAPCPPACVTLKRMRKVSRLHQPLQIPPRLAPAKWHVAKFITVSILYG